MLDLLSFPVSALMWALRGLLSVALAPDAGLTWALSVALLVISVRAVLVIPAAKQLRSVRRMRELQPQITALRRRHAGDSAELNRQLRQLQQRHELGLLGGCLPALLQLPVFVGLYHLLTQFSRSGLTVEQSSHLSNGVFEPTDVASFLHAQLFGAPLSAYVSMPGDALQALGVSRSAVLVVVLPLIALAGLATYVTGRQSARQQSMIDGGLATVLVKLGRWVFPLFPVVGGLFFPFPIAITLYWLTNNAWTLAQNHVLTSRLDAEDSERAAARAASRLVRTPRPGQKPRRTPRRR